MSRGKWIVGALVLGWVAAGAPARAQEAAGKKVVAVVNGDVITEAELEDAVRVAGPMPQQLPEQQRKQHRMEALGFLIDVVLMQKFLDKNAPVDRAELNKEIDKKINELREGLKKQGKSMLEFYRETNQNEAQLRKMVAHEIAWENYARRYKESDFENYYKEYRDFFDQVTVHAYHILIRVRPDAPESERVAARAKLADVRKQILDKKIDFAEAAKKHSQCLSAAEGGDLKFIPRKLMVDEPFAKAAFALEVGQVSEPVDTDAGVHLIKVTERKAGEPSDYNKIKQAVREMFLEETRQQILQELRKKAVVQIKMQ